MRPPVKPTTLAGYRYNVEHWIIPRIGGQRLQGLRPAEISTLYRDLMVSGGRNGKPLGCVIGGLSPPNVAQGPERRRERRAAHAVEPSRAREDSACPSQ